MNTGEIIGLLMLAGILFVFFGIIFKWTKELGIHVARGTRMKAVFTRLFQHRDFKRYAAATIAVLFIMYAFRFQPLGSNGLAINRWTGAVYRVTTHGMEEYK